jgi:hypothetical protein
VRREPVNGVSVSGQAAGVPLASNMLSVDAYTKSGMRCRVISNLHASKCLVF